MSKQLLVNIRGCNGAGKSTIPLSMMDDPEMFVINKNFQGKTKKILTVFPSYKWVALGSYFTKTGGLDKISGNELTRKVLMYALKHYPDYDILMEGVISSTIFSTYAELFNQVQEHYPDRRVVVLNFVPPYETCIQRIYSRNGNKPIKEDAVLAKWKVINRNVDKFKNAGFISLKIDNSKTPLDQMLNKFLKLVNKYKEE